MICKSQEEHVQLKWILRWWTMFSEHSSRFRISNAKIIRILTTTNISFLVMFKCLKWVGWSVQRVIYFDLKLDSVRWIIVISGYHFIDQARMKWLLNYRILNYKIVDHSMNKVYILRAHKLESQLNVYKLWITTSSIFFWFTSWPNNVLYYIKYCLTCHWLFTGRWTRSGS